MLSLRQIYRILLFLNLVSVSLFVLFSIANRSPSRETKLGTQQELLVQLPYDKSAEPNDAIVHTTQRDVNLNIDDSIYQNLLKDEAQNLGGFRPTQTDSGFDLKSFSLLDPLYDHKKEKVWTRSKNPFNILGAYPYPSISIPYKNKTEKSRYDQITYGLFNDDDYCEKTDFFNLVNPSNMFKSKNFFSDYSRDTIPRQHSIPTLGKDIMPYFAKYPEKEYPTRQYHLDHSINNFFINMDGFHKYHKIGTHFLCATQMYNRIPGSRAFIRKDELVESVDRYAAKFSSKPQCFNKKMFFPYSFRLYNETECKEFFTKINSDQYNQSLEHEPIQYIIKVSHGSHSAEGVFLLDSNQTLSLNTEYEYGSKCGNNTRPLIAQDYVTNPLLLDLNNKFDFRVYMLIASTNPLMVYYHDGFLRATLSVYDKFSTERGKHLTNTHLAESIFAQAKQQKINGMSEEELRDYHIWKFEELQEYLLESGKVTDPKWLDNHLKPQFKKAMVHIVKMASDFFWKGSNVYGLFGLDFMLDDKFNLWFIEGNPNPQLIATSQFLGDLLKKLLTSLFDIQYNLYQSRMKRMIGVIRKMQYMEKKGTVNLEQLREEFKLASKNKFEPEYKLKKGNSFSLIMDESIEGPGAYFGNIENESVNP